MKSLIESLNTKLNEVLSPTDFNIISMADADINPRLLKYIEIYSYYSEEDEDDIYSKINHIRQKYKFIKSEKGNGGMKTDIYKTDKGQTILIVNDMSGITILSTTNKL